MTSYPRSLSRDGVRGNNLVHLYFYMQVFREYILGQPLIRKHSYWDHMYFGDWNFVLWNQTPDSKPVGGARGYNLEHFSIVLYHLICMFS